ncbi:MAG: GNAT family acetyltransferase [Selenomonadaceae bacterium]|nr:GNAT family acetyltransferase [Selenomonadaceae bacterium]
MSHLFYTINIHDALDKNNCVYMGEDALSILLDGFSCSKNLEVEHFLKHNAIEFTKKNQSVTHMVLRRSNSGDCLAGYFTLAVKPVSVRASAISKTIGKKLSRISVLNKETDTYTASAYLIAQLGKNFALPREEQIQGTDLLNLADITVKMAQNMVGGVVEFLECEDNSFLLDFYATNGFKAFDRRITEEREELIQLLRFI